MREHDPALCDHLVIEERLEWGRSVIRSHFADAGEPPAREEFAEDDDTGQGHTVIGPLLGAPRAPGTPTCPHCGAPLVTRATPRSAVQRMSIYCDGRCELDVEL